MLKVNRNNLNKWELLLRVLSEEMPENNADFQAWLHACSENRELYKSLKGEAGEESGLDKDKIYSNISGMLPFDKKRPFLHIRRWFGYAAVVFLFLVSGAVIYNTIHQNPEPLQSVAKQSPDTLFEPGSRKAWLLSSGGGAPIALTDTFLIKKENGIIISNKAQGVVRFERSDDEVKQAEYHTIYVPKGGEYELLLADGSRVFLNSETKITFPSYFEGDRREVELTGEGFFEIEKMAKPFIVKTENMDIEVTGTSFNVSAYPDNRYVNTTLVEGSVTVCAGNERQLYYLSPGHHLHVDKISENVSVQEVGTDLYTAWVKGVFMFRNQPLHEILSQLSRWYDFTVEYEDSSIREMKFTGSAEKAKRPDYLFMLIESVTDIKYRSEGNRIVMYR
jgi:ferric-dicitrate binding protein FerR (iron transport regulator)